MRYCLRFASIQLGNFSRDVSLSIEPKDSRKSKMTCLVL